MDKFESSYYKHNPYQVACSQCQILYVKSNDDPFICLICNAKERLYD